MQPKQSPAARFLRSSLGIALAGLYFLIVDQFYPFREQFEFDPDEGIELIKAMLVARGDHLYTEIWNEQPPLFTHILALTLRLFGFEVDVARLLVLAFSALLIAAAYYILLETWGLPHAAFGSVLIMLLPYYTQLSVSVMIGLPGIALAMLSFLALVRWHKTSRWTWLLISAVATGLSVLTKLITGFIIPIVVAGLLISKARNLQKNRLSWAAFQPALIWSMFLTAAVLLLGLFLVGPQNIGQLVRAHLLAAGSDRYINYPGAASIYAHLADSWPVLLLGFIGALLAWGSRRWLSMYLAAWAALGILVLSFHRPVWYHHQLLVTIPAAMLGGIAAGEGQTALRALLNRQASMSTQTILAVLALPVFVFSLIALGWKSVPNFIRPPVFITHAAHTPWPENMFLVRLNNRAAETNWLVTNMPMYAFRTGLPVPPDLAVIPEKRINTGLLTEEQILERLVQIQPEQVLMGRREFPLLEDYLDHNYKLLYERGKRRLYVLK